MLHTLIEERRVQAEDSCSRGAASPSPRRLRTSPSKPTYVPVSKWELLQGAPPPAGAAAGLLHVGLASSHASVAIRPRGPESPAKGATRSPDIRREPPLSPHATVV